MNKETMSIKKIRKTLYYFNQLLIEILEPIKEDTNLKYGNIDIIERMQNHINIEINDFWLKEKIKMKNSLASISQNKSVSKNFKILWKIIQTLHYVDKTIMSLHFDYLVQTYKIVNKNKK